MTQPHSTAREAVGPNKPAAVAKTYFAVAVETPRRDVDLFGPTTVRVDAKRDPAGCGVPVLYLSAYVDDPDRMAQRLVAALEWLADDRTTAEPKSADAAAGVYLLPAYVEDVDFAETLFLPDDLQAADWSSWTTAIERRVSLSTTASQLASLEAANAAGLKACPSRLRARIGAALRAAYEVTFDQAAAA